MLGPHILCGHRAGVIPGDSTHRYSNAPGSALLHELMWLNRMLRKEVHTVLADLRTLHRPLSTGGYRRAPGPGTPKPCILRRWTTVDCHGPLPAALADWWSERPPDGKCAGLVFVGFRERCRGRSLRRLQSWPRRARPALGSRPGRSSGRWTTSRPRCRSRCPSGRSHHQGPGRPPDADHTPC